MRQSGGRVDGVLTGYRAGRRPIGTLFDALQTAPTERPTSVHPVPAGAAIETREEEGEAALFLTLSLQHTSERHIRHRRILSVLYIEMRRLRAQKIIQPLAPGCDDAAACGVGCYQW